ncbi:ral guanine nucleotide dissociation stimulator-like [Diceros bicornis minor]|uniref:ral guanine nucleotide dissociation stimulator-like n=1 Tax=Diceros bicornis minor TaxID=77932 RepID=UPI0026F0B874|nr:ral guanine nucleotide dissociation stimulator-like [Diceros bicornis minor]
MGLQLPTSQLIVFPSAGVLNPQELLTTHHPLCSAEHLHSLSEKDTRRSFQEGPSKSAIREMLPQRAHKKWQQAQGVVLFLGTFLTDLVMLDTVMQDYLEGLERRKQ